MKNLLFISFLFLFQGLFAQDEFLAKQYLKEGNFKKAVFFYERLTNNQPNRNDYSEGLVYCYQQLEQYTKAQKHLEKTLSRPRSYPTFFIELGYNYSLQQQEQKAAIYYNRALEKVREFPEYGYGIGLRFQKYALLDWAKKTFILAMERNPNLEYNLQLARIYGEEGNISQMFQRYLQLLENGKVSQSKVLRQIEGFINEDPENQNNILLKKSLLQKLQKQPNPLWNQLLSWLFVQQHQYKSAFTQEKAIYKRSANKSLARLENLGHYSYNKKEYPTASLIFKYISEKTTHPITLLKAKLLLLKLDPLQDPNSKKETIKKEYDKLMATYGYQTQSLQLQMAYAQYLTFTLNQPAPAIKILKKTLRLPLDKYNKAKIKMSLGDILVYNKQFNQALINFSQVQKSLKNDVVGQNARFKVAQTSFYKGDFDWALNQLKVLRGSSSQLIANDAMQLSLLISDNVYEDSTQVALKKYAKADLLSYQNKTSEAIAVLGEILEEHKGARIEDEALLKQAQLLEKQHNYDAARLNYKKIITFFPWDILADDANYALGKLYETSLNEPEKAKQYYEKIIYDYQDSFYFPLARKNFRRLRGDNIN